MALWSVRIYRKINWKRYYWLVVGDWWQSHLREAGEISRLRFTELEMTTGMHGLRMLNVRPLGSSYSAVGGAETGC